MVFFDGGILPHQRSGGLGHALFVASVGTVGLARIITISKGARFQSFRGSRFQRQNCGGGLNFETLQPCNFETLLDAASPTVFTDRKSTRLNSSHLGISY